LRKKDVDPNFVEKKRNEEREKGFEKSLNCSFEDTTSTLMRRASVVSRFQLLCNP